MDYLEKENYRFKFIGFKLISLELENFSFFGNIKYDFINFNDKQDKIYTTVIVGPNGTRKSLLFNLIIYIFKCINDLKDTKNPKEIDYKKYSSGNFHLKYALNNEIYEIKRIHVSIGNNHNQYSYTFIINGQKKSSVDFELPLTIIGNSINITDKFPFYRENEFAKFQYLGIKFSPQTASTKSFIRKTIDFVAQLSFSPSFLNGLNLITETFIGENKTICISYKTVNFKRFYDGKLSLKILDDFFSDMEKRYYERQKMAPYSLNSYRSIKSNNIEGLRKAVDYCNKIVNTNELKKIRNSSGKLLMFNLSNPRDLDRLKEDGESINILYTLKLLFEPKIEIVGKIGNDYSLEECSSGEHNLITSLIGIMATIKQDSLLLIDEPEISLHPNWQMKYVSFLKKVLSSEVYKTSHIVIATHSHFILSDLEVESSNVIGLARNDEIEVLKFDKNLKTFGWSAEEIMYIVFRLKTVRNYFMESDLINLLGLISNGSKDKMKIQKLLSPIQSLNISTNDPLNAIIEEVNVYLKNL